MRNIVRCGTAAALALAAAPAFAADASASLDASATVSATCTVSTPAVTLDEVEIASGQALPDSGGISVTCTSGTESTEADDAPGSAQTKTVHDNAPAGQTGASPGEYADAVQATVFY